MNAQLIRTILEILYFLCAPIIAIAAIYGLRQLKISKEVAMISAKRESYKLAAEQCKYYAETLIPILRMVKDKFEKEKILFVTESELIIDSKGFSCKIKSVSKEQIQRLNSIAVEVTDCQNKLEALSLFFISGLADETIGYRSIGEDLCESAKPFIVATFLEHRGPDKSSPINALYILWCSRGKKQKLAEKKADIDAQLRSIENKTIRAIGT